MPERKVYEMIDKDAPVLAFDVSKGSSHCQGFYSFGKPSGKPAKVAHSRSGMAPAAEIAETLTTDEPLHPVGWGGFPTLRAEEMISSM